MKHVVLKVFRLTPEQVAALEAEAAREGISVHALGVRKLTASGVRAEKEQDK